MERKLLVEVEVGLVGIKGANWDLPAGWEWAWIQDPWTGKVDRTNMDR